MAIVYWDPSAGPWQGQGRQAAAILAGVGQDLPGGEEGRSGRGVDGDGADRGAADRADDLVGTGEVADVVDRVQQGRAELGVVALEDSVSGLHGPTVDELVFVAHDVVVSGEVDLADAGVTTRWVSLRRGVTAEPMAAPQTMVFAVPVLNRPGTVRELLSAFSSRGINLDRFWPRPLHGALGMYGILLEFEGSPTSPWVADAIADVMTASSHVKHLGTFPAGRRDWAEVTGRSPSGPELQTLADLERLVARLQGDPSTDDPLGVDA